MGLITKEVEIILHSENINYYQNLGYMIPKYKDVNNTLRVKRGTKLFVKIEDLQKGSTVKVNVECDGGNCKNPYLKPITWQNYLKCVRENGKYYCSKCTVKERIENSKNTKFKNGKSFEQWCLDNNKQDILNRWDYELNDCNPSEIAFSVHNKYYFKCPKEIHKSELKNINNFTSGSTKNMSCKACNSFAQWGIDNLGEDFLEKYWDYEKNTVDPWDIDRCSIKYVYIKCQKIIYHGSYKVKCASFTSSNSRCSYCGNFKVHKFDSLGYLYPHILNIWSDKNKKSPYEYSPKSEKKVWWKCPDGIHKDFKRSIIASNNANFRCPECQYSKGEEVISNIFINKQINYIPQKEFEGLIGLGNGNLSYDFYLSKYNILIEYQGRQHEKYIKGMHKSKKDFIKQQEHDKRKREYALDHNIKLLEIWYYDFNNIEKILQDEIIDLQCSKFKL